MWKYFIFSCSLFIIGTFGIFLSKKHLIIILISFEILLLSSLINFIVISAYLDDLLGQVYGLLILTVGATESSIGLAILIVYYRLRGAISVDLINVLKG